MIFLWKVSIVVCLLSFFTSEAQLRKPKRSGGYRDPFLNTQWWIGIRLGSGFTKAKPTDRYSAFTSTQDPTTDVYDKKYKGFGRGGAMAGLEITFYFKGLCLSFQPNYRRYIFSYTNYYAWGDPTNPTNAYEINFSADQKLDYIELPLIFRYEPLKGHLRPYVQIGGYYSMLNSAYKSTKVITTDYASGAANSYVSEELVSGSRDLFIKSNWGWLAGAGVSYPVGNFRLGADITYRRNTNVITNAATRYENERITGTGDIMDDVKLRNWTLAFTAVIPLRYISKRDFKAE
jgi:hypothetical protein